MGVFDTLKQQAMNEIQHVAEEHGPAAQKFAAMLQAGGPGCVAGVVEAFKEKGLEGIVSSWVVTGKNLPVTAAQIESVFGPEKVAQFAAMLGLPPEQASEKLAQWLPTIIDKLTPNGHISPA